MLLVPGIRRPFADVLGRNERFELVQLRRAQLIDLFETNQCFLAKRQHIILVQVAAVHLDMEIRL